MKKRTKSALVFLVIMIAAIFIGELFSEYKAWNLCRVFRFVALVLGVVFTYKCSHIKVGRSNLAVVIFFLFIIAVIVLGMLPPRGPSEKVKRVVCASQLKQIGLAMKYYASDNNGWFPDKDGSAGFEQLRRGEYLTDYKIYVCPSTKDAAGADNKPLTGATVSYTYKAGLRDTPENAGKPLVWDKPGNHMNFGCAVFVDGHVEGISSKTWLQDIKNKTENKSAGK